MFPPSQEEANQASMAAKPTGKGARKRQSSVPLDSDTAKAKQAKAQSDEKDKKAGAGKGRIPFIPKQELSAIAVTLAAKVQTVIPSLKPKHYRTIQNLAADWYKAIYHTRFQLTKAAYLKHLYDTAVGDQKAKEPNQNYLDLFIKALNVLKYSVDDPTTVGLPDPSTVVADTAATQSQSKPQKGKTAADSYAAAVTGKDSAPPIPIGAKTPSAKASAKSTGGAIGAPTAAQAKAKSSADNTPIGAAPTAKQDSSKQPDPSITADSAMDDLTNAPSNQSFADFQAAQAAQQPRDDQAALDAQTAQDVLTAQTVQAELDAQAASDAQAAQDTQAAQGTSQSAAQAQGAGALDWDDADDAAMQQALWQSRQQAQMQGSDPTASSSAATGRTVEDEIQYELQMGRDFRREAEYLEKKMSTGRLTSDEVLRLRKVFELCHINQQRVADLCERQIQENQARQAQDTSVLLGSLQPLQPSKPKTPAQKPAPMPRIAKTMPSPPPPAVVKQLPGASGTKAPPPVLPAPMAPPAKNPPAQSQSGDKQESDAGPPPESLPSTKISGRLLLAPTSPKGSSAAQLQQPVIVRKDVRLCENCNAIPNLPVSRELLLQLLKLHEVLYLKLLADLEERLEKKREAKR